jgi:putative nucleotidyltransferase with HDIG domain
VPTERAPARPALTAFLTAVIVTGGVVIAHSVLALHTASLNGYALLLAVLTIVGGRFAIPVPGRPATVSVSEVFVFASALLFGPSVPVLTVAIDGLYISLTQKNRRLYRTLFNVAEPAISTWAAGQAFFLVAQVAPGARLSTSMPVLVPATIAMAAAFFVFNSGLTAMAVALENGTSPYQLWRGHAWYLAVNYHAAASVATLAISSGSGINFGVVGLVGPMLVLSYVAYREASTRADEAHRHVSDVERLYRASVEMLAIAVDAKDQVTHGHIRRVQRHALTVAGALGVTDARELKAMEAGALLHDIGKLAVPDYVLNKPSALTQAEFETMKKHATMGARILTAVDFPYPIVPIVRHHHEQWDGRGYPDGLVGAEIPLGARILAIVDCFDALTSDRPYRPRLSDEQAIAILLARKSTFYDPAIVDKFVALIPELRRRDDVSSQYRDAQVSVIAGLSPLTPRDPSDAHPAAVVAPGAVLHPATRQLIDERALRLSGAEVCLFAMTAAQDALVVAHATAGVRDVVADLTLPVGCGVSGWVAANRSTIRHAESVLDLGDLAAGFAARVCTSVPVFVRTDLFGVLTVYSPAAAMSDEMIAEAGLLAQEVGVSIARGAASPQIYSRSSARPVIAAVS